MTDRPILFSAPMVRAILDGRKTQTRRILRPQPLPIVDGFMPVGTDMNSGKRLWETRQNGGPVYGIAVGDGCLDAHVATIAIGDWLWVRESWQLHSHATDFCTVAYMASINHYGWTEAHEQFADTLAGKMRPRPFQEGWRPSIHMPRWASRLTLTVTDVRVERLRDISEANAMAEGIVPAFEGFALTKDGECWGPTAKAAFRVLWDSINGDRKGASWAENPWVVAISFDVAKRNIDQ